MPTEGIQLALGGCASNAGLDLAKLGVKVGVSGCVGEDAFGQFIIDTLRAGCVDTAGVHRIAGTGTRSTMPIGRTVVGPPSAVKARRACPGGVPRLGKTLD